MDVLSYLYWRQPEVAKKLHAMMPKTPDLMAEKNDLDLPLEEWECLMKQPPHSGRG